MKRYKSAILVQLFHNFAGRHALAGQPQRARVKILRAGTTDGASLAIEGVHGISLETRSAVDAFRGRIKELAVRPPAFRVAAPKALQEAPFKLEAVETIAPSARGA